MAFISEIIGRPVIDIDGKPVGILKDVLARSREDLPHPLIEAIQVERKEGILFIDYDDVAVLISTSISLKRSVNELHSYTPVEEDIFLAEDVLDKQIIDTNGARVVRVNDLEIIRVNGDLYISNVDIGGMGILRRIGLDRTARKVTSSLRLKSPENYISWDFVELLKRDKFMRLKVPMESLSELHPADIAEIISDMSHAESGDFLETLDVKHLADALEEVEPDFQASLVKDMPDEKVADVLEEMSPDEAADLLAELPKDRSEDLLELMEDDEAEDVRKLLSYPEDTAGGLMTTEFGTVHPDFTAAQAIVHLRETASEAEQVFYVYVTDSEEHLIGVFSLSDLIFAQPDTPVTEFMHKRVVSVPILEKQDRIAQTIAKYDLLAVPVVDEDNRLHGIVTADDALDKIIPTAWKKRLPRLYI